MSTVDHPGEEFAHGPDAAYQRRVDEFLSHSAIYLGLNPPEGADDTDCSSSLPPDD
ncbi:MAG TPA: hypothetical protein VKA14_06945 [Gammaproteobacteria bacterium]|nr:hypothetical protein [Gammaproteobacteria bacterium]